LSKFSQIFLCVSGCNYFERLKKALVYKIFNFIFKKILKERDKCRRKDALKKGRRVFFFHNDEFHEEQNLI
jgi:hypothetical protein